MPAAVASRETGTGSIYRRITRAAKMHRRFDDRDSGTIDGLFEYGASARKRCFGQQATVEMRRRLCAASGRRDDKPLGQQPRSISKATCGLALA